RDVKLSVVLVAGSRRERAQRVVDGVAAQTAIDDIELIIVDLAPEEIPRFKVPERLRSVYVRRPGISGWGAARSAGVRAANGEVVAFIEDHCLPEPDWASILIEAHRNGWGA